MSEYSKLAGAAGDQYLATLSESQDAFLKSLTPYQEWLATLPKMPAPAFAADFPTFHEIGEANFAFANKFLKQQKKFFEKLFETTAPAAS